MIRILILVAIVCFIGMFVADNWLPYCIFFWADFLYLSWKVAGWMVLYG